MANRMNSFIDKNIRTIDSIGEDVFAIYNQLIKKLDETFENKIDYEGRNIIDYTSIAIELTKIVIGISEKEGATK